MSLGVLVMSTRFQTLRGKKPLKTEDTALYQWPFMPPLPEYEFWGCLSPVTVPVLVKISLCVLSRTGMYSFGIFILLKHWKSSLSAFVSGRFSFELCCVYEITGLKTSHKAFTQWVYNGMHSVQRIFFPSSKWMLKNPVLEVGWWCMANITSKQGRISCRN